MNEQHPAWKIFNELLDQGVDSDQLIAASSGYSLRVLETGETPIPLAEFLQSREWEKYRH
jgi:hypothetical protein